MGSRIGWQHFIKSAEELEKLQCHSGEERVPVRLRDVGDQLSGGAVWRRAIIALSSAEDR